MLYLAKLHKVFSLLYTSDRVQSFGIDNFAMFAIFTVIKANPDTARDVAKKEKFNAFLFSEPLSAGECRSLRASHHMISTYL